MISRLEGNENVWVGPVPADCQICADTIPGSFWDARTANGRWAVMCPACHTELKLSEGQGHGQAYVKQPNGQWIKVRG